mmetsp:Transcript_505/g.1209  ORF Transcript_505/g.1209 Transcript_505/m.1209 type:complete len:127 (+) Transcript_505:2-382(+)
MAAIEPKAYIFGGQGQDSAEVFDRNGHNAVIHIYCAPLLQSLGSLLLVMGRPDVVDVGSQTWSELQRLPAACHSLCTAVLVGDQDCMASEYCSIKFGSIIGHQKNGRGTSPSWPFEVFDASHKWQQ